MIMQYLKLLVLLLTLLPLNAYATDVTLSGTSYTLNAHPRILIGGNVTLTELRSRMVAGNRFWTEMRDDMTAWRAEFPSYPTDMPTGGSHEYMATYALMYMLDSTAYATWGADARTMMLKYTDYTTPTQFGADTDTIRHHLYNISLTYDWIYPLLSTQDKEDICEWVNDVVYPFTLTGNNIGSVSHNLSVTQFHAVMFFALATYEDNETADGIGTSGNSSETMLAQSYPEYTAWRTNFADPLFDGHNYSGQSYGGYRIWPYTFRLVELLNSAVSLDTWSGVTWADDVLDMAIQSYRPGTNDMTWPDGNVGHEDLNYRSLEGYTIPMTALSGSDAQKHMSWHLENVFGLQTELINNFYKARSFLWIDPDWAELDYRSTFDTGRAATGVGLYVARSDWTNTDATYWGMAAAKEFADHQGNDGGSIKIWRDDEWLIYENGADGNGMKLDTNFVNLDDGVVNYAWASLDTTGGRFSKSGSQDTSSTIGRNASTATFNYARGDLTQNYIDRRTNVSSPDSDYWKVSHYTRSIVHIKASDYLVIYDNMATGADKHSVNGTITSGPVEKRLQFHLSEVPTISGDNFSITRTNSKLVGDIVLPVNVTLTGTAITDKTDFVDDTPTRLDIETSDSAKDYDPFLTVLKTGPTYQATIDATLVTATGGTGVEFDNTVAMFTASPAGADIAVLTYTVDAAAHIVADLPINTDIDVSRAGSDIAASPINSGSGGIIEFTGTAGSAEYVITAGTPPAETCLDGIQNQDETGVDCGGTICGACEVTPSCDDTPSLCPNQTTCEDAGWNWCTDICQSASCAGGGYGGVWQASGGGSVGQSSGAGSVN